MAVRVIELYRIREKKHQLKNRFLRISRTARLIHLFEDIDNGY